MEHKQLHADAVGLLQQLVRVPSFSREEERTAGIIEEWLREKLSGPSRRAGAQTDILRHGNNVCIRNLHFDPERPTILLCSHHDTVRPSGTWTRDPFDGAIESTFDTAIDGGEEGPESGEKAPKSSPESLQKARLHGLGSNDAGASAVSLAAAFRHFYERNDLKYNLILALVGEEEISGPGGVRSILPLLGLATETTPETDNKTALETNDKPSSKTANSLNTNNIPHPTGAPVLAIVGEPTGMQLAIAERGLMVLDCVAAGRSGHAARDEGDNAIYHAIKDIEWFQNYRFPRKSPIFGELKMSVTMISAGTQHNVVPAECRFTVDCRVTEQYTNEEVLEIVCQHITSTVTPRSLHLRSSSISPDHPIVQAGIALGLNTFGSPTTSDQVALTMIPSVKVGPGQSSRSHAADEYIELTEIQQGIELYIKLLDQIL
ncbi:MAG: M20/M25/M40 family metallo-hydrolase [Alistipes sp.]|jgi:acetylornithine deacetylase|nr:M20/M25/M40 family metallo-hydrolase [Alistipes sp.]